MGEFPLGAHPNNVQMGNTGSRSQRWNNLLTTKAAGHCFLGGSMGYGLIVARFFGEQQDTTMRNVGLR
jgi:hypothetical protein